jgi:apolipoprotein N-acyltransferase
MASISNQAPGIFCRTWREDALYQGFKRILCQFARDSQGTLLLGTNEATGPPGQRLYHNTTLCLAPDLTMSVYSKMHLVPFGDLFSFLGLTFSAIALILALFKRRT